MKLTTFSFILTILFYCQSTTALSQNHQDTITYSLTALQLLQKNHVPHYMVSNRHGILNLQDSRATLLRANLSVGYQLFKKGHLSFGADAIYKANYQHKLSSSIFIQQGYATFQYDFLKLIIGKKERTVGTHANDLSSGSLAISQNAAPIPQILLEVPQYTSVPFTKGYLQFKGTYAHAWLNDQRFIDDSFLHEKSLYVRLGKFKFKPYAGLVHFVIWGGQHPTAGEVPSSFRDYLRVITSSSGEGISSNGNPIFGEQLNALGDNLGILDVGANLSLKSLKLQLYYQKPYEDRSGTRFLKNRDGLLGLSVHNNNAGSAFISKLNYEYVNTLYQSGPGLTDPRPNDYGNFGYKYGGRDNYYNNYLYRSGWTYKSHILGTPLFFTKERTQTYIKDFSDPDSNKFDFNIVNNRVVAHHIGFGGRLIPQLEYKLLATTTLNYGTYGGQNGGIQKWESRTNPDYIYEFSPPLRQNYLLLETTFKVNQTLKISMIYTMDTGELSENKGLMLGIKWSGSTFINPYNQQ
ncbi:capsule assembly Wzi family protein [Porifericola rhodea]|uniref:capsule assembly Wzi family protein n=1 Tax=Porifericola rhodea TaxID=930972 RepID=UPI002666826F|nr:capsule assembly Wzi family protein [Porifericola rhodea]WKN33471.1 capsule assembly Wzi family protein [Porifericola rhodea]